ncbi:hypothetical protein [Mucilaginibacter aquatilis]|uniref:Uncharacterized protein n=1 Tax=Mucilaginibacter aquatilis TaxID=1517760 RepID=A0A6I4IPR6_9SPHI|nr:hypothetical protein [Mucilaginibacter aquatilis]MVN90483.1 hypothetical protein [Mucilaginibacter aquatilis]
MENKPEIIKQANYDLQLREFEGGLIDFLEQHNLPSDNIFVNVPERVKVFKNLESVISQIDRKEKEQSLYLSKFIAGVASGLFDAALNYLWDETIIQIRKRVVQYDLEYFYDNAVSGDKRKRLRDESDLNKVDDYDLIKGAKEIGLISELGAKHLEYINYMRNWASAAHPNQNAITGLQLISWLETCVNEVISLPISNQTTKIKQLLAGIKTSSISSQEAQEIAVFFTNLTQEQVNNLVSGFFGIYTKPDTNSQTLQNINRLLPLIWNRVDEDTRDTFGLKYGNFVAANYQHEKKLSREFLQIVNGESYIPNDLRGVEIETSINNLLTAHRGMNNFYNEPSFAKQLQRVVGDPPKLPKQISKKYVLALVEVFITNGNGITMAAQPIYISLLSQLDSHQANVAVLSFNDSKVSDKLQHSLCARKFRAMIELVKPIVTSPPVKELIEKIEKFSSNLDNLKNDKSIKNSVDSLRILLK